MVSSAWMGRAARRPMMRSAARGGNPASYERTWRRLSWRHNALTQGLLAATGRPVLRRGLVPAADTVPWLFRAAVNELARPA